MLARLLADIVLKRSFSAFTSDRRVARDFGIPLCCSATQLGRSTVLLYSLVELRGLSNLRRHQQSKSLDTVRRELSPITPDDHVCSLRR